MKISVDATAPGQPIERIWPFYGYDEVNYSTTAEGEALLKSICPGAYRAVETGLSGEFGRGARLPERPYLGR